MVRRGRVLVLRVEIIAWAGCTLISNYGNKLQHQCDGSAAYYEPAIRAAIYIWPAIRAVSSAIPAKWEKGIS